MNNQRPLPNSQRPRTTSDRHQTASDREHHATATKRPATANSERPRTASNRKQPALLVHLVKPFNPLLQTNTVGDASKLIIILAEAFLFRLPFQVLLNHKDLFQPSTAACPISWYPVRCTVALPFTISFASFLGCKQKTLLRRESKEKRQTSRQTDKQASKQTDYYVLSVCLSLSLSVCLSVCLRRTKNKNLKIAPRLVQGELVSCTIVRERTTKIAPRKGKYVVVCL